MDNDNREVQIRPVKMEFPSWNFNEAKVENMNQRNVELKLEMNDTEVETKPTVPLYNLYFMKIKEEVHDPDAPFFSLTYVVKLEPHTGQLNTQYFDHSSIIQQNLKTERNDEEGNCEDPLSGADLVPLGEIPGTSFEIPNVPEMDRTGDKKKRHRCETCGKNFATNSDLTRHKRSHTGEKPFKCETCGKYLTRNSDLTTHKRSHSGEKPFKCETCGKCFTQSQNLTRHKMSHSGKTPFKCETCEKSFADNSTLTLHKRSHSGEKPFECGTCGKRFAQSSHLTSHRRTHSGEKPFECKACGKCFGWKKSLTKHMIIHI